MMSILTQTTGEYFLNFFKQFIGTPAILIGLFALVGCLLQRKKITDTITSTLKTTIGFLIIGGGAGILAGAVGKLGSAFNLLFGINGVIANNDVIPGLFLQEIPNIVLAGSLIMIVAMAMNILLARITGYKYIYLTGHVLFYMSTMLASVLNIAGLNQKNDLPLVVITGSLLMSVWMIISPAILNKHVIKITKSQNIAIGHTGALSYFLAGWIGILVEKVSKRRIKSTEEINFPKGLSFLRNTNVAIAITMFILYLIIYFSTWGAKGYDAMISAKVIQAGDDVFVQGMLQSFTFAAGVEVLLIGVRMFIAEITPSFKGISDKIVPNAKPALDCPTVFPYAPNAVLIGFISSFLGGIIGMGITIGIVQNLATQSNGSIGWAIIIPSIVPHFFVGATAGVFGNARGGIVGAILGSFINGILISFVPFLFFGLGYIQPLQNGASLIGWGDSDFILGLPIAAIGQAVNHSTVQWLLPLIATIIWLIFPFINLLNKYVFKKTAKISNLTSNSDLPVYDGVSQQIKYTITTKNKIVAVCGQGLGSSLLIEINIKSVVAEINLEDLQVSHTNINSFNPNDPNILIVICGTDLQDSIAFDQKIVLDNLLDQIELKTKLIAFLQQHND